MGKDYYNAQDIMDILGVKRTTAYEVLHSFERRGQLFRFRNVLRVRKDFFEAWLKEHELYRGGVMKR